MPSLTRGQQQRLLDTLKTSLDRSAANAADFCPSCGARRMAESAALTWAQRLKRVFNIDIETCSECGGAVKVMACIEDPVVIRRF